jgi:hypothetical protein
MKYFLSRLREPSTWAGLSSLIPMAIAASAGPITPQIIGGFVAGLAAVFMKEQGGNA